MKKVRTTKPVRTVPFDAAAFLDDDETRLAYLNTVLADGDPSEIVAALGTHKSSAYPSSERQLL